MNTHSLRNTVVIGKLSITNWEAKKKAKSVEAAAETAAGAKHGTISARKALLPGAEALEAILKHSAGMRTWWNTVSAPWFDNGMRAYAVAGHIDIQAAFGDMARERDRLVQAFLDEYPTLREKARFDLNDLFSEDDYPTPAVVASRFTCAFEVMPLPNTDDFRVMEGIDDAELARLQAEADARAEARVQEAMSTTVTRLYQAVKTMADRLTEYTAKETADAKGNRFYESWVANVQEMASMIPQLNITGDPALNALAEEAKELAFGNPLHFKDNFEARTTATTKARELSAKLSSLLAAE